jgi:hypothetical protein
MSETAQTIIKAALRSIGAIASGETPTTDELNDGLESMKMMFRHWSSQNIRLYFTTMESFALTGAASYTIGSGGTFNTVRPTSIRGASVEDTNGSELVLNIIDEKRFRDGYDDYLFYSPEYPLGKIYTSESTGTLNLYSLKPLTDPTLITSTIAFPPEYDEAIKYGLALRLAPEYGKEPSPLVAALAQASLNSLETKNFSIQMNAVKPELIKTVSRWNINEG